MSATPAAVATAARLRTPLPRDFEVAIAPDRSRLAQVRRIAAAFMRYCSVPESLANDVVLVVSELVANAIEHGQGAVGLRLRHTVEEVRVEVTDGSPAPARLRAASPEDEHGRGLLLVSVLARAWGVSDDGRTTWATFRVAAGRP
ncbi:ATP-binding protein [Streptomyces sp. NPDC014748]|uniref:ATP-binding protein n=1 Tax=Streptomyces sp. NPDC014748 TaxID=3364905 RepID=UPI0036F5D93C